MKKQLIKDLRVGEEVETQALVVEANKQKYSSPHRAGEHFMKMVLGDVSGNIKGIIWDLNIIKDTINKGDVIFIKGEVTEYYGPQVVINEVRKLDPEKVNRKMFQPVSNRDPQEMLKEIKQIITEEISNYYLQKLLKLLFSDKEFVKKFAASPAAKTVHHNYVGGLLEHTLEVVYFCRKMMEVYPDGIDGDIVLTGAILHDMGKIEEYDPFSFNFDITDRGKLLGHISIGKEILDRHIAQIEGFPRDLRLELEHVMLTHHGHKEWGSPEIPKTVQAFALFHADLLSARMSQFLKLMQGNRSGESDWSEWDRFLERSVYLKKPDPQPAADNFE